jgi:hypothetical protein
MLKIEIYIRYIYIVTFEVLEKRLTYIHIYNLRFIPKVVAEATQIFLRDAHVFLNYIALRNAADMVGCKIIEPLSFVHGCRKRQLKD